MTLSSVFWRKDGGVELESQCILSCLIFVLKDFKLRDKKSDKLGEKC